MDGQIPKFTKTVLMAWEKWKWSNHFASVKGNIWQKEQGADIEFQITIEWIIQITNYFPHTI